MSQERFWTLLSRKLAREATGPELEEIQQLIQQNPEWQFAIQAIQDTWDLKPGPDEFKAEAAYAVHLHRMSEQNIPFPDEISAPVINIRSTASRKWWKWAAAAMVLFIGGWFAVKQFIPSSNRSLEARQINEITTRPGNKTRIELPDGSIVWLNSGSKLTYDKDFNLQDRQVYLTGEGYFDVAHNKEKPFIIHTTAINVKVLGTVFNVKAYPNDKRTETSLIRGSVEVTIRSRPDDKIILSPNEKLIIENVNGFVTRSKDIDQRSPDISHNIISLNRITYSPVDSTVAETEWINNRLVFRDESLEDLAVKMERWYNITIDIENEELKGKRLSGIFENETITQAMEALKLSIPLKYEQQGNRIIIH